MGCLFFFFLLAIPLQAQSIITDVPYSTPGEIRGDSDVADRYAEWALNAMNEGRWAEALNALERARDFSSVSSDVSYLLALARNHFRQPLGSVLQVLDEALGAARWRYCSPEDARYLKAEILFQLKRYREIISLLPSLPENSRTMELRLLALRFLPSHNEFRRAVQRAFDIYPRDTEIARIYLAFVKEQYDAGNLPSAIDTELLELIFRRLPILRQSDPELSWMAAPFMRDTAEARRMASAYWAVGEIDPFSLPVMLNLGVIDDETAIEMLFKTEAGIDRVLDRRLLEGTFLLLRDDISRENFNRNLSRFTGLIKEDTNGDGFYEMSVIYRNGMLVSCIYDYDQDGFPELELEFISGDPAAAVIGALPEANDGISPFYPLRETGRRLIHLRWELYPALLEAKLGDEFYFLRPLDLMFAPVEFIRLCASGLLFPEAGTFAMSRRSLVVSSLRVERPSREFRGAIEVIELNQGIPVRAREYLEGRLISETDFLRGRPISQRVDLDLDGRLETVRHFRRTLPGSNILAPVEELLDYLYDFDYADSDWDGDGIYERRHYN